MIAHTSRGNTAHTSTLWKTETCCSCHVPFAFTNEHYDRLKKTGEWFYCPSGHKQHYSKTTEQSLREQLAERDAQITREQAFSRRAWEAQQEAEAREKMAAGETKRIVSRIASGVCPCCNRTFSNLARHMKTKHSEHVQQHKIFIMTKEDRATLYNQPLSARSRSIRRSFVGLHSALTDEVIARMMIDGGLYTTAHLPTVAKWVSRLR